MLSDNFSLWALFASAFLSATVFPGGSEVVLGALVTRGNHDPITLWGVATAGNTLGGMSTWGLGWLMAWMYPVAPLTKPRYQRALKRLQRWGSSILLLSWVPVIGDPLCFVAGWFRVEVVASFIYIGVGKALRYAVVVTAAS